MAYETNKKHKQRIDSYLEKMATINASLGTDSTPKELKDAYKKISYLEQKIKGVDEDFYKIIAPDSVRIEKEMDGFDTE